MKGAFRHERCIVFLQFHVLLQTQRERKSSMINKVFFMQVGVLLLAMSNVFAFPPKRTDKGYIDAISKGADTWIVLSVVDDGGAPVPDADVRVTFAFHEGFRHEKFHTDEHGMVSIKGRTTGGSVVIVINKKDYYETKQEMSYLRLAENRPVKDDCWQPWGEKRTLRLRKILNPIPLNNQLFELRVPILGKWIGFDLNKRDWTSPLGSGEVSDIEINVDWDGLPPFTSKKCKYDFRILGAHNGGYFNAKVLESSCQEAFRPKEGAVFDTKKFSWIYRDGDLDNRNCSIWKTVELIMRTRTILDDKGGVKCANYASIRELSVSPGTRGRGALLEFRYVFNSTPNDTNLEARR